MKYFLVVIVLLTGCGDETRPESETPISESAPVEFGPRSGAYSIVNRDGKYTPFVQHRYVSIVPNNATDRKLVTLAMKEVYEDCKRDIERTESGAPYKRIHIRVYDCADDANDGFTLPICHVQNVEGASPEIADFKDAVFDWKWRNQSKRPNQTDTIIYREYRRRWQENSKQVDAPYYDSRGIMRMTPEDFTITERKKKKLAGQVADELCDQHELPKPELAKLLSRLWLWMHGDEVSDIESFADSFLRDWEPQ